MFKCSNKKQPVKNIPYLRVGVFGRANMDGLRKKQPRKIGRIYLVRGSSFYQEERVNYKFKILNFKSNLNFQFPKFTNWNFPAVLKFRIKNLLKPYYLKKLTAVAIIFAVVFTAYFQNIQQAQSANYTWNQATWAGGADTGSTANHTNNRTNWTKYYSADANVSAGAETTLTTTSGSTTQTTTAHFNDGGATSQTAVANDSVALDESGTTWVKSTLDDTAAVGNYSSIALGLDGFARISYYDGTGGNLKFVQCNDAACSSPTITTVDSTGDVGWYSSIAVAADGYARIAYVDASGSSHFLKFAQCTNAACSDPYINTVDSSADVGDYASMVLDASGFANISYYDDSTDDLKFAQCTNAACSTGSNIRAIDTSLITGLDTSIVMGLNGFPRISYRYGSGFDLRFAQCNDAACSAPTISDVSTSNSVGWYSSLAIDPDDGFGRISYHYATTGDLYFAQCTNAACSTKIETVVEETDSPGNATSLELGTDGFARISHIESVGADLKFVQCANAACSEKSPVVVDSANIGGAQTSLALDGNDRSYISYYDLGNTALKYAYQAPAYYLSGTFTSGIIDTGQNNQDWGNFSWNATLNGQNLTMKVRSCNDAACSGETAISDCADISSGTDASSHACVNAGDRYFQYRAALSGDTTATPSLDDVTINYNYYPALQTLTSSWYDSTDAGNVLNKLEWTETVTGADVQFQLRSAPDSSGSPGTPTGWMGPDGTDTSYFTSNTGVGEPMPTALTSGGNDQWMQYKMFLSSSTGQNAPTADNVALTYVVNATPVVSSVTASENSSGVLNISYTLADSDYVSEENIYFVLDTGVTLNDNPLSSGATSITLAGNYANLPTGSQTIQIDQEQINCASRLGATLSSCSRAQNSTTASAHSQTSVVWFVGTSANIDVDTSDADANSTTVATGSWAGTWNIKADLNGVYAGAAQVRVVANDSQLANQVSLTSGATASGVVIDTKNPTGLSFTIDNTKDAGADQNNLLNIAASDDDATKVMNFSNIDGDFTEGNYVSFANSYQYAAITSDPATVYMRVRDSYGNYTDFSAATPAKPQGITYYDTSNALLSEFREFIAWGVISAAQDGSGTFSAYKVYRSTDDVNFSLVGTISNRTTNYYLDSGLGDENVTLAENLTDSETDPITVSNAAGFPSSGTVQIGTEQIIYTSKSGNDLVGISRGMMGTTATAHSSGDDVVIFREYYYKITAEDNLGNVSDFSSTVSDIPNGQGGSDTTAPTISNVTVTNINTTSATVTWDTDEVSSSYVGYSTDTSYLPERGISSMVTSHSITLTGLDSDTTYNIRVKSYDALNNSGQNDKDSPGSNDIGDFTFDTLAGPEISSVAVDSNNTSATISWVTTTDSDTYVVYTDTLNNNGAMVNAEEVGVPDFVGGDPNFNHAQTITTFNGLPLVSGDTYYFYVKSTDASDVMAVDNNGGSFYSFSTTQDDDAPIISAITDGDDAAGIVSHEKGVVSWMTDEPANSTVNYGTISGSLNLSEDVATYDTSHFVILSGLSANTTYYYTVTSADINTNEDTSTEYSFTTSRNPEEQHDPLSLITMLYNAGGAAGDPKVLTDTKAVIAFNTDQPALCTIEYGTISGSYTEVPVSETQYNENHSMHLTGLIFSTPYYYRITCEDNLETTVISSEYRFTTSAQLDTAEGWAESGDSTAPSISGVSAGTITGESATISWDTNEEASSYVRYGTTTDYGNMAGNDTVNSATANYVKAHEVIINGLVPGTKYYYTVLSTDAAGNIKESGEENFTTKSTANLSGVKAVSTKLGEVTITWKSSKKISSIVEYGETDSYGQTKSESALTTDHSITLSGLKSNAEYYFMVKGKDADNNWYSSQGKFTPKSPPTISNIEIKDVTENGAKISFITNIATDALVSYTDNGDDTNAGSQGNPQLATSHEVKLENLSSGITFSLRIKVRDEEGNETEDTSKSFTTGKDENPPKIDQVRTDSALAQSDKVQTIIYWTTDELATTSFIYKEGRSGQEKETKISDNPTSAHVAVITVFKPGTVYYFKVKSIDSYGNEAISGDYALLTPQKKENIIQIIINNFQDIFSWTKF